MYTIYYVHCLCKENNVGVNDVVYLLKLIALLTDKYIHNLIKTLNYN